MFQYFYFGDFSDLVVAMHTGSMWYLWHLPYLNLATEYLLHVHVYCWWVEILLREDAHVFEWWNFLGYRGYGCTDSSTSYVSTYLSRVLFLTLSNLMFIPAVVLATYYRLYIEALIYFFNMFFSTVSQSDRSNRLSSDLSLVLSCLWSRDFQVLHV